MGHVLKAEIVETDVTVASALARQLREFGFDVVGTALTSAEAIAVADDLRPNLLIMDVDLGGEPDGIDTARCICERMDVPVIFIASCHDDDMLHRAMACSPYGILLKPCRPMELRAMARLVMQKLSLEERLEEERRHAAMREQRLWTFMRQVVDLDRNFVYVKDAGGRYVLANRALAEAFGVTVDDMIGRTDAELDAGVASGQFARGMDEETHVPGMVKFVPEESFTDVDGRVRWLQSVRQVITGADGRQSMVAGIATDISSRKYAEASVEAFGARIEELASARSAELQAANRHLLQARDEALRANAAKGEFLAMMSHEIRTPMNAMLGMMELLSLGRLDDEQSRMLDVVLESSRSLVQLINDILDFSKIEAGRLDINNKPVNLPVEMERVIRPFREVASRKDLQLELHVGDGVPIGIMVDPLRLNQVLSNLLGNAIKFTDQGRIDVRVTLPPCREGGALAISVRDTGVGIHADARAGLFEPYVQAGSETTRRYGGTGLGLAICRKLARLMGGDLVHEAEEGPGTVMTLLLPVGEEPVEAPCLTRDQRYRPVPGMKPAPHGRGRHVPRLLVVDDVELNRLVVARQLRFLGFEPDTAASGQAVLERWSPGAWDLILLDCQMPDLSGCDVARRIRAAENACDGTRRSVILAYTARVSDADRQQCLEAGMDDFVIKPTDMASLKTKLGNWLALGAAGQGAVEQSRPGLGSTA